MCAVHDNCGGVQEVEFRLRYVRCVIQCTSDGSSCTAPCIAPSCSLLRPRPPFRLPPSPPCCCSTLDPTLQEHFEEYLRHRGYSALLATRIITHHCFNPLPSSPLLLPAIAAPWTPPCRSTSRSTSATAASVPCWRSLCAATSKTRSRRSTCGGSSGWGPSSRSSDSAAQ